MGRLASNSPGLQGVFGSVAVILLLLGLFGPIGGSRGAAAKTLKFKAASEVVSSKGMGRRAPVNIAGSSRRVKKQHRFGDNVPRTPKAWTAGLSAYDRVGRGSRGLTGGLRGGVKLVSGRRTIRGGVVRGRHDDHGISALRVRSRSRGHFGGRSRSHRRGRYRFGLAFGLPYPYYYPYYGYGYSGYGHWETLQKRVFVESPGTCYKPEQRVAFTDGTFTSYETVQVPTPCGEWQIVEERVWVK